MSAFDKIIGYESIKEELRQLCDMIHNMDRYEKLGAKMPKGLLLHGIPGVGKSLMARSFIEESGRRSYVLRRNKPDGDFINEIKSLFTEAAQNAPAIILLDDMDKFAVDDHSNEEYIAVQACIDEVAFSDVYVVATANELYDIPDSLLRAGRFDRKIEVETPRGEDALKIIRHYLAPKAITSDVNVDDIAKMLYGKSCASLETILNEAAIYAGYERCEKIFMDHIVRATLRNEYGASDSFYTAVTPQLEKIAYHEAGHVVISEILKPDSVGLASLHISDRGDNGGLVAGYAEWDDPSHEVLMALAGKAATELKYGRVFEGVSSDINKAVARLTELVVNNGFGGMSTVNIFDSYENPSEILRARQEAVIHAELERHLLQTKEMLITHRYFLDSVAAALLEKHTLLSSDVQKLREVHL